MKAASGQRRQGVRSAPAGKDKPSVVVAGGLLDKLDAARLHPPLDHLAAALKKRWKCYRKDLKRCQKKFSENAVHQFRVESRRLFSLIELPAVFLPAGRVERIRRCLKRHLDTFGDLRDTQVQLQLTKKFRKDYPEATAFQCYLRKREKRVDRRTRKDVKRIKTKPLAKLISACRNDLQPHPGRPGRPAPGRTSLPVAGGGATELGRAAGRLLQSVDLAFQRTCKLKQSIDPARTKTIHCTRIAFKRFRYMVETLSGFLPIAPSGQLAAMHRYQTLMGDIQDMEVLIRAFDKFSAKKESRVKPRAALSGSGRAAARSAKNFRKALLRRRQQLITRYLARADELHSFWPPVA